jgi:hypothetical protein
MKKAHPAVKIVTTSIDEKLNEKKYIVPGTRVYLLVWNVGADHSNLVCRLW